MRSHATPFVAVPDERENKRHSRRDALVRLTDVTAEFTCLLVLFVANFVWRERTSREKHERAQSGAAATSSARKTK